MSTEVASLTVGELASADLIEKLQKAHNHAGLSSAQGVCSSFACVQNSMSILNYLDVAGTGGTVADKTRTGSGEGENARPGIGG